jgi:hypothetical protein
MLARYAQLGGEVVGAYREQVDTVDRGDGVRIRHA